MSTILVRLLKVLAILVFALLGAVAMALMGAWFWVAKDLPDPRAVLTLEASSCPDGTPGRKVRLAKLRPYVAEAIIAAEQPGYWQQGGIPTLRAIGSIASRGMLTLISDEHQPLPRAPLSLSVVHVQFDTIKPGRTIWWHAAQAVQSDRIELSLSKTELLGVFINHVYFGRDAYGLTCASLLFYNKQPETLGISEAAMLVALLKSPSSHDPLRQPDRALERRNLVIDGLLAAGAISSAEAEEAKSEPLPTVKTDKQ